MKPHGREFDQWQITIAVMSSSFTNKSFGTTNCSEYSAIHLLKSTAAATTVEVTQKNTFFFDVSSSVLRIIRKREI